MNRRDEHLDDEYCADLALGLVSPEERTMALGHAERCPACESRLRAHAGAAVRARADVAAGVGLTLLRPRRSIDWRWPGAAAAAAVLIALALVGQRSDRSATSAPQWLTTTTDLVRTRADGELDPRLAEGMAAYARQELPAAIEALASAKSTGADEQMRLLFLGHAHLASGDSRRARESLERVDLTSLPQPWREEAARSLAAAWRATGAGRRADSLERAHAR